LARILPVGGLGLAVSLACGSSKLKEWPTKRSYRTRGIRPERADQLEGRAPVPRPTPPRSSREQVCRLGGRYAASRCSYIGARTPMFRSTVPIALSFLLSAPVMATTLPADVAARATPNIYISPHCRSKCFEALLRCREPI